MICGRRPNTGFLSDLCVHEIYCGVGRQKSLDKPYATLVLCFRCNQYEVTDKAKWPEARQLCLLQMCMPNAYDLAEYNGLVNPRAPDRITRDEVDAWKSSIPWALSPLPRPKK